MFHTHTHTKHTHTHTHTHTERIFILLLHYHIYFRIMACFHNTYTHAHPCGFNTHMHVCTPTHANEHACVRACNWARAYAHTKANFCIIWKRIKLANQWKR